MSASAAASKGEKRVGVDIREARTLRPRSPLSLSFLPLLLLPLPMDYVKAKLFDPLVHSIRNGISAEVLALSIALGVTAGRLLIPPLLPPSCPILSVPWPFQSIWCTVSCCAHFAVSYPGLCCSVRIRAWLRVDCTSRLRGADSVCGRVVVLMLVLLLFWCSAGVSLRSRSCSVHG